VACARDSYQPLSGQNFCVDCPGDTQTDAEAATDSSQCKGIAYIVLSVKLHLGDERTNGQMPGIEFGAF